MCLVAGVLVDAVVGGIGMGCICEKNSAPFSLPTIPSLIIRFI